MSGRTIHEVPLVSEVKGGMKIPISDGGNLPQTASVEQINKFISDQIRIYVNDLLKRYVEKIDGKGLSTNDFTNTLKSKLDSLSNYDDTQIVSNIAKLQNVLDTLVSGDISSKIESFNEIISFLENVEDSESFEGIVSGITNSIKGIEVKLTELGSKVHSYKLESSGIYADYNNGWIGQINERFDGVLLRNNLSVTGDIEERYSVSGVIIHAIACYSDKPKIGKNEDIYLGTATIYSYGFELKKGTKYFLIDIGKTETNNFENAYLNIYTKIADAAVTREKIADAAIDLSKLEKLNGEVNDLFEVKECTLGKLRSSGYSVDHNNGSLNKSNTSYDGVLIKNDMDIVGDVSGKYKISNVSALLSQVPCFSEKPKVGNVNKGIFLGNGRVDANGVITLKEGTAYFMLDLYSPKGGNFDSGWLSYETTVAAKEAIEKSITELENKVSAVYPLKDILTAKINVDYTYGYRSEKYFSVVQEKHNNLEVHVVYDNTASSWAILALRLGTVEEVKKGRFLYLNHKNSISQINATYNRTDDWGENKICSIIPTEISEGYKLGITEGGFNNIDSLGLLDTDIIYVLIGINDSSATEESPIIEDYTIYLANAELNEWKPKEIEEIPIGFIHNTEKRLADLESVVEEEKPNKIIAWGDSITMAYGRTAYTEYMKEMLSGYDIINCGVGGETLTTIMARQGSDVPLIQNEFVLPSDKSKVVVADGTIGEYLISGYDGKVVVPLLQGTGGTSTWTSDSVNPCYVNGIECTLTKEVISGGSGLIASNVKWLLNRNEIGNRDITIPSKTPIILSGFSKYGKPKAAIFFCYQNGGYNDMNDLVAKLKKMVELANTQYYIVVSTYTSKNQELEDALRKEFGLHFFNSRVYLSTNALYDLGLEPTTDSDLTETQISNGVPSDVSQMEKGLLPSTFWNKAYRGGETTKDSVHMNDYGYKALGTQFALMFKAMGL